jgi:hypothetical protein
MALIEKLRFGDGTAAAIVECPPRSKERRAMTELEAKLNHILHEHQQESGLHMIGGQRKLVARLLAFCEELLQEAALHPAEVREPEQRAGAA